jgi:hypothetical protein
VQPGPQDIVAEVHIRWSAAAPQAGNVTHPLTQSGNSTQALASTSLPSSRELQL